MIYPDTIKDIEIETPSRIVKKREIGQIVVPLEIKVTPSPQSP
jgi:hypothetical protein